MSLEDTLEMVVRRHDELRDKFAREKTEMAMNDLAHTQKLVAPLNLQGT